MVGDGTGACGINCMVCGLFRDGKCSPCGSGTEAQAHKKLTAQLKLLGSPCPILHCAVQRGYAYCSADCESYPCSRFSAGPYPLSQAYLDMQVRRRSQGRSGPSDSGATPPPDRKLH